jgi:hypothetical protein
MQTTVRSARAKRIERHCRVTDALEIRRVT